MSPRIAFAGFNLESVTAVPQVAGREAFERVCTRGAEVVRQFRGTNTVPGGCLKICEDEGATFVPLFHTLLGALGPASDEAVDHFTREIIDGLRKSAALDGVVLFLHGACWAAGYEDVERHIIDAVRSATSLPIAVALDYHGNIDLQTLRCADIAVAYRHSPHIDMGETGERAARALLRMLREGRGPGLAVVRPNVVIPSIMSATMLEPLASIIGEARAAEVAGDCDISVLGGFSYADSANTGMSVICVDWDGQDAAEAKAEAIATRLFEVRKAIGSAIPVMTVDAALAELERRPARGSPVVLLEHADRMNDSTYLLRALLDRNVGRVNAPFLFDPETAAQAHAAGEGAEIRVSLAGKTAPETGGPVEATARVLWSGPKSYNVSGRYQRGAFVDLGLTALLQIGNIRISVVSAFAFAVDGDPFYIFGERPEDYDVILLRSKTHFRDFYEALADRILVVDTPDLGPADVRLIRYKQFNTERASPWRDDVPSVARPRVDQLAFEGLYSLAAGEWPTELRLPIREEPGLHLVEGLTELENKISKPWVGHPDEVLMVNLHWAMVDAYHAAFKKQPSVRHEDLDVSRVRDKFEAGLKRIQEGITPTWTDDDRAIVARYFAANASKS